MIAKLAFGIMQVELLYACIVLLSALRP